MPSFAFDSISGQSQTKPTETSIRSKIKLRAPLQTVAMQAIYLITRSSNPSLKQHTLVVSRHKKPKKGELNISSARTSSKTQQWAYFWSHDTEGRRD